MKLDPVTLSFPMESFNSTSTKSVGICSPRFLKPTRHLAVICETSGTICSSSCWKVMDAGRSVWSFGGSSFFLSSRLILTTTSIFRSTIAAMLTLRPHLVVSRLHGYYAEVPGHLAPDFFSILFLFFFFLFRPTDPKSENAFDKKRKKKRGWPKTISEQCLVRCYCVGLSSIWPK